MSWKEEPDLVNCNDDAERSNFTEQLVTALSMTLGNVDHCSQVCLFGIGHSAVAGEIISDYADECCETPIPMMNDPRVPGWVQPGVDGILMSYSGYPEEMEKIYDELRRRGCRVHCITSGGWLAERCRMDHEHLILVPTGLGSMNSTGLMLGVLASLLQEMGVCQVRDQLWAMIPMIRRFMDENGSGSEKSVSIASLLYGRISAIYSTTDMRISSKRWKLAINEVVGDLAFFGEFPEFDHNEIVGWSDPNAHALQLVPVILRGEGSGLTSRLMSFMTEVLVENGREVVVVDISGDSSLSRNICGVILGDSVVADMKRLKGGSQ